MQNCNLPCQYLREKFSFLHKRELSWAFNFSSLRGKQNALDNLQGLTQSFGEGPSLPVVTLALLSWPTPWEGQKGEEKTPTSASVHSLCLGAAPQWGGGAACEVGSCPHHVSLGSPFLTMLILIRSFYQTGAERLAGIARIRVLLLICGLIL